MYTSILCDGKVGEAVHDVIIAAQGLHGRRASYVIRTARDCNAEEDAVSPGRLAPEELWPPAQIFHRELLPLPSL